MKPEPAANACPEARRAEIIARYLERTPASAAQHARAARVLPGGINRNIVYHRPHPLFFASGLGATLTDLDGNAYLDCNGNYTSMIHGNCVPEVMAAVQEQLARGTAWAGGSAAEATLAEMLLERLPAAELVRFVASGSEAAMLALRAARAVTGRPLIAKMEGGYHGLGDYAMVSVAPPPDSGPPEAPQSRPAPGVLPAVAAGVLVLPFNDAAATQALLERHARELAAVIVEPVMGAGGMIAPVPGYLALLRELTQRHGIVLIFDEVISFRLHRGGAQALYGIAPDLTVLGKIIGGGYPIGAVAGKARIMGCFDPAQPGSVTLSGTFHANPVALAAGIANLALLTPAAYERLDGLGAEFTRHARPLLARAHLPLSLNQVGSLFALHASEGPVTRFRAAGSGAGELIPWLYLALLNEGILLSPRGMGCLSTAMTAADLRHFLAALAKALAATGALLTETAA